MENHPPQHRRTDSDNDADQHLEYMEQILRTLNASKEEGSQSSRQPPSGRLGPSLYESSSIQGLDILKEFPWLNEGLEQHRPSLSTQRQGSAMTSRALPDMQYGPSNSTCTVPSGEGSSLRFFKEDQLEENASLRLSVTESSRNPTPAECFTEPPSAAQLAWAQFMLDSQAFQSAPPYDPSIGDAIPLGSTQLFSQSQMGQVVAGGSNSVTPINSESLSSSISDDEAPLIFKDEAEGFGTSVESGKRKTPEREEANDEKSDKFEAKKKQQPINRPRKKGGIKRVREPRYAIKTRTEVDVMDDGYKWRKYGQKAVKNSPHPRNYYRCTTAKCPVRKRVERSFEDPDMVITTYEGTHTHITPGLINRAPPASYFDTSGGLFPPLGLGPPRPFSQNHLMSPQNLSNLFELRGPQWLLPHQQAVSWLQENLNWSRAVRQDPVFRTPSIKSEPIQTFDEPNPENSLRTPQSQTNFLSNNLNVSPQSQAFGASGSDTPLSSAYQVLGVDSFNLSQQNRESLRSRRLVDLQPAASTAEIQNFGRYPTDYASSIGEPAFDRDTYHDRRQNFVRRRQDEETTDQLARVQSQEIVVPPDEDVAKNLLSRRPP